MRTSNFVTVTGNLGAEVEIKRAEGSDEIARMSVAETVMRPNAKGEFVPVHTNWIPVTAFGGLARRAVQSLKKGDRVTVHGTIRTRSYEKDGQKHRGFEVVADSIERAQLLARAESALPTGEGA